MQVRSIRPRRHPLATVCLAVLVLGVTAGCSSPDGPPGSTSSQEPEGGVAVMLSSSANSFEQAILEGAKDTAEELGGGVVREFDGKFDAATQIAQIQDAVTSGQFSVLVIEPVDQAAVAQPLEQAAAAGIKVVCVTTPCGTDATVTNQVEGQTGVVAYSFEDIATELAAAAIQACETSSPCTVAHLNGDSTFASDRLAGETIKSALAAEDGIDLVAQQDGKYDTATSRQLAQDMLQRNPDIDVLVASSDQMAIGAEQAIEAADRTGEIRIVSAGASERGVAAVESGDWFADVITQPRSMGARAAEIGILAARGEDPGEVEVDAFTLSPVGAVLFQENVADFEAEWK